jgi:MOSC domain-containing protein YiiM
VRPCKLPSETAASPAPVATRSLVACLAAILEVDPDALPCPPDDDPWPALGEALATHGLGVVPVRDPAGFAWGGWWVARFADPSGRPAEPYVVMAGTPSDVVFAPAGTGAGSGAAVVEGWVPTRPALDLPRDPERVTGVVEALFRAPGPAEAVESLLAAEVGLPGIAGDRYADGTGHFSPGRPAGRALTLIEAEALDLLAGDHGIRLPDGAHRRNVVTRGIDLHSLLGQRFRIGDVECYAQRVAEPCAWLQTLTPPGTLRGLVHRGGIRADVVVPGTIKPGDQVRAVASAP